MRRDTRDRLFQVVSIAFGVFALNRVLLSALAVESEARTWLYLLRAGVFALIVVAIRQKNYVPRRGRHTQ